MTCLIFVLVGAHLEWGCLELQEVVLSRVPLVGVRGFPATVAISAGFNPVSEGY